jgi:hypothetical protein
VTERSILGSSLLIRVTLLFLFLTSPDHPITRFFLVFCPVL